MACYYGEIRRYQSYGGVRIIIAAARIGGLYSVECEERARHAISFARLFGYEREVRYSVRGSARPRPRVC